jgi:TrwC relaxase
LSRPAARGRRGYSGTVQVETSGFVAAAFRQRTSRANDPHLRTHVLIANMAEGSDGRWGALDARLIYAHAKAAGYLYESHLRHRLSTDLGMDWTEVENGIADVRGVPEHLIERFSKRSREIRGALDEVRERLNAERARLGLPPVDANSASAMNIAARETRAAKLAHLATADLRAGWREEAGPDLDALPAVLHRPTTPVHEADDHQRRRVAAALTEKASTFGRRDAVQAMAADVRRGLPAAEVLSRTTALLASRDVIPVVGATRDQDVIRRADGTVAPVPLDESRWSTPEMLATEERLVVTALGRQEAVRHVAPGRRLHHRLAAGSGRPPVGHHPFDQLLALAHVQAAVNAPSRMALHYLDERTPLAAVHEEREQLWAEPPRRPLRQALLHDVRERIRSLPAVPPDVTHHIRPLVRVLEIAATGPTLTQAGYLPPGIVRQLVSEFGWWEWSGSPRSEVDVHQLQTLMEFGRQAGLVHRTRTSLRLPSTGRRALSDPAALWDQTVRSLAAGEDFTSVIRELLLVRLLRKPGERDQVEGDLLPVLAEAGWRPSSGEELTREMVSRELWEAIRPMDLLGIIDAGRWPDRGLRLTVFGMVAARAILWHRATRPQRSLA